MGVCTMRIIKIKFSAMGFFGDIFEGELDDGRKIIIDENRVCGNMKLTVEGNIWYDGKGNLQKVDLNDILWRYRKCANCGIERCCDPYDNWQKSMFSCGCIVEHCKECEHKCEVHGYSEIKTIGFLN